MTERILLEQPRSLKYLQLDVTVCLPTGFVFWIGVTNGTETTSLGTMCRRPPLSIIFRARD